MGRRAPPPLLLRRPHRRTSKAKQSETSLVEATDAFVLSDNYQHATVSGDALGLCRSPGKRAAASVR